MLFRLVYRSVTFLIFQTINLVFMMKCKSTHWVIHKPIHTIKMGYMERHRSASTNLGISIGNLLEMKVSSKDTIQPIKKIKLLRG